MNSASTLAFALAASVTLLSTTGAAWPTMPPAPALSTANVTVLPETTLSETPASADRFVNSIGIDSSYQTRYSSMVTQQLLWSGVKHLRDSGSPTSGYLAQMKYLGQHGINHSLGMGRNFSASDLQSRLKIFAPYIDFVEPENEADNASIPNWARMRADQQRLWKTVRADRAWDNIAVFGPSFADAHDHAPLVGPLDQYEDYGQLHNGTCNWNPGTDVVYVSIDVATERIRPSTKYRPIVTSETGFSDDQTRTCNLTDDIIAKYVPRSTTERWLHGESRAYFDYLVDVPSDEMFGKLGLLHANGSPKPQFLALGNLIRLLADPGSAPKQTHLSYSISGATSDVHHLLLARRDGTYDLLIYRELPAYDHYKKVRIKVDPENIHITVPGMKHAALYRYNSNWSFYGTTLGVNGDHSTGTFPISDAMSVIHIGL